MYPYGVLNVDPGRRFFVVMFAIGLVLMLMVLCVIFVVANRLEPIEANSTRSDYSIIRSDVGSGVTFI